MTSRAAERTLIVAWVLLGAMEATAAPPPAQRATDVQALQRLETDRRARFQQDRAALVLWAQQAGESLRHVRDDGGIGELLYVRDGCLYAHRTDNASAADSVSADELWPGGSSGLNLTGTGVLLREWDGGEVRVSHVELAGAVNWADDSNPGLSDHATHVAGTMVGLGVNPAAQGMAWGASLDAYDWTDDDAEMAAAAAAGARVSNHSYSFIRGWYNNGDWYWYGTPSISETEDAGFGFYDSSAATWDAIAYNAPYYLICKSAGNDRGDAHTGGHWVWGAGGWEWSTRNRAADGGSNGYDSIGQKACAKNLLTVGAVNDIDGGYTGPGDVDMTSFSGWGPTDDGRIKPDLVANGVGLWSSVATGDAAYGLYSGTSMSSPSLAGTLSLLVQHYRATHAGADMRSATLKGLAIHTADECGSGNGPDYRFGWGLLNALSAAEHISLDATTPHVIQELSLADGETIEQTWYSDGSGAVKVTICWTDPAGTPVPLALDPPDLMLVNDLDLRVATPSTSVTQPWLLNPGNPNASAGRGDNVRDNVEVVSVNGAAAGIYTVRITHKGAITDGPQDFALLISGAEEAGCLPGEVPDCNNNCAPAAWIGDGFCDDGVNLYGGVFIDFNCAAFSLDGGDCAPTEIPFIMFRHKTQGRNAIWFMDGVTKRPETGLLPTVAGLNWRVVGCSDFDDDGHEDLLWHNSHNGNNRIWFMDGTSLDPTIVDIDPVGPAWSVAAVEDVDGDGKADIVFRNEGQGRNALWFMDGAARRPETGLLPDRRGRNWKVAGCDDFDDDGSADILWRNVRNGNNRIWFMNGTSLTPTIVETEPVGPEWLAVAVDDVDGDGKADIVFRHETDGRNALWFMDGAVSRPESGSLPDRPGRNWKVKGCTDFDGDGDPDLLFRQVNNGNNQMWFMEGTSLDPVIADMDPAGPSWAPQATGTVSTAP